VQKRKGPLGGSGVEKIADLNDFYEISFIAVLRFVVLVQRISIRRESANCWQVIAFDVACYFTDIFISPRV
jgi:hypothetical protein